MTDLTEVRERLAAYAATAKSLGKAAHEDQSEMQQLAADLHSLLADHARQAAEIERLTRMVTLAHNTLMTCRDGFDALGMSLASEGAGRVIDTLAPSLTGERS